MRMVGYRLLIFDLDGTLLDSFPGVLRALNLALEELGMSPVGLPWIRRHIGRGATRLMKDASGGKVDPELLLKTFRQIYSELILSESRPFPGVTDTLETLRRTYVLALASNKPDFWIHKIVRNLGWEEIFSSIFGPQAAGAHKPDPSMIHLILKECRMKEEQSLLIGDMSVDGETGTAARISVLGVTTGAAEASELIASGCFDTIGTVSELPAWLEIKGGKLR